MDEKYYLKREDLYEKHGVMKVKKFCKMRKNK